MRRIALWFASTAAVLMLLAGYHTSFAGPLAATSTTSVYSAGTLADRASSGSSTAPTSGGTGSGSTGSGGGSGGGSGRSGSSAAGSTAARTVTGDTVQTQWGPVQVEVSVTGTDITGVSVLQYPTATAPTTQINGYALPILVDETMSAQSAHIDMVSGATYTSTGYLQSLQSALDRAGL